MKNKSIRLAIDGLRCAGCVSSVENALRAVDGVAAAEVNFAGHTAFVTGNIPVAGLIAAVTNAGYGACEIVDQDLAGLEKQAAEYTQYRKLLYKAWFALAVAVPALMVGIPPMLGWGDHHAMQMASPWLALLTLLVMLVSGRQFFVGMWRALRNNHATMDTLVALGMAAAWSYSALATFVPALFPATRNEPFWDVIPVVIGLVVLGQALEMRARGRASSAVTRLVGLKPRTARVVRGGQELDLPLVDVCVGDILRVRPGERIAVDGLVIDGHSSVDASMLTGEAMPVEVAAGSNVTAGTLNMVGSFLYRATRVGADTALAHIIELVRQAQGAKPAIGRLADRVAGVFVPVVLVISVLSFAVWYFFGPEPQFNYAMVVAVSVLIIACPCALGLATPMAVMVGVGLAAEQGVLIRNGNALQQAGKLTAIILDKTGTVTQGRPDVTAVIPAEGWDEDRLLQLAASLEAGSEHPLATAVLDAANSHGLTLDKVEGFAAIAGHGVHGLIDGRQILFGNLKLLQQHGIDASAWRDHATTLAATAATLVYLAVDAKLAGLIAISDPIKLDSRAAIERLQQLGLKVILLTGDQRAIAESVAVKVGINTVFFEVLPQDKGRTIAELMTQGEIVGMVGDGINDAIALASSDVGFAIGTGTDVAIEAADIILMSGSLHGVANAIAISRATMKNIRQNLFGAFLYNALGIPIAAGALYPFFGVLLNPMLAGAAMAMSSLTVVSNAGRLRRFSPRAPLTRR